MMQGRRRADQGGFTLIEIVVAVAIVAIFVAAISPMVFRHLEESKISRAKNETETIARAVTAYFKDVGVWPVTNRNGPSGNNVDRVVSSRDIPRDAGRDAGPGASNWGRYGTKKMLGDYLYYNNPDDDSSARGSAANQENQDWPLTGPVAWRGPYVEKYEFNDPWHHAYVINARYFPNGHYGGTTRHKVFVLSAGPNGKWETPFDDGTVEEIRGDDIGTVITIEN